MSEPERRRIIFLWTYLEWGGAQMYFIGIIRSAVGEWDVMVMLPRGSSTEIVDLVREAGASVEYLDCAFDVSPADTLMQKFRRSYSRIHAEWTVLRVLRKGDLRNSILHVDVAPWQSWQFFGSLSAMGANVFTTMHNALPENVPAWRELVWRWRLRFVLSLSRFHLFTANRHTKDSLRDMLPTRSWDSIEVTPAAIDPDEIRAASRGNHDPAAVRASHKISADAFVVLTVGQFIDRKGRWILLEAAQKVIRQHPDMHFVWLMPAAPTREEIHRIRSFDLGDSFTPVVSGTLGGTHADVLRFFRIADAFALASLVEGLPIAVLEAMAMGIPTISTDIFAIREAIQDDTGILVKSGDVRSLAEAIIGLRNDPALRERLARNGRAFVLDNYDQRSTAAIALAAYRKSLAHAN